VQRRRGRSHRRRAEKQAKQRKNRFFFLRVGLSPRDIGFPRKATCGVHVCRPSEPRTTYVPVPCCSGASTLLVEYWVVQLLQLYLFKDRLDALRD